MTTVTLQVTIDTITDKLLKSWLNALQHQLAAIDATLDNADELWEKASNGIEFYDDELQEELGSLGDD